MRPAAVATTGLLLLLAACPAVLADDPENAAAAVSENAAAVSEEGLVPPEPARFKVPSLPEQARARELLEELYAEGFKQRAPAARLSLARKLMWDADRDDLEPAQRYVMLETAASLFSAAGDAGGAMESVQALSETFEIDERNVQLDLLRRAYQSATTPDRARLLAEECLRLLDEILLFNKASEADAIEGLANLAESAANRGRDADLRNRVRERALDARTFVMETARYRRAIEKLQRDPEDANASLAVGRFLCCWEHDWPGALPRLAAGSDVPLRAAAVADLAGPAADRNAASLGNAWWDCAQLEAGAMRAALLNRAVHWYRTALVDLTGLERTVLEKRITEAGGKPADVPIAVPPATMPRGGVSGKFLTLVKGFGAVWVNGKEVQRAASETGKGPKAPYYSDRLVLRTGDVVVVEVESPFTYHTARMAFIADDGSSYLAVRCGDLNLVEGISPESIDAGVLARLKSPPRAKPGRADKLFLEFWSKNAEQYSASEWFFGPDKGRYVFAFTVDPVMFVDLKPRR